MSTLKSILRVHFPWNAKSIRVIFQLSLVIEAFRIALTGINHKHCSAYCALEFRVQTEKLNFRTVILCGDVLEAWESCRPRTQCFFTTDLIDSYNAKSNTMYRTFKTAFETRQLQRRFLQYKLAQENRSSIPTSALFWFHKLIAAPW